MWAVLYVRASSREGIRAETLQSGAEGTHHTGPWGKSVPGRGPSGDRALHMGGYAWCVSVRTPAWLECGRQWPGLRENPKGNKRQDHTVFLGVCPE